MLEVTGIEKRYRGRTILKMSLFRANPGECIGIVGGKWMRQDDAALDPRGDPQAGSGSIRIDGQEALGRHRLLEEEKIAYVPQENPLIPELTAFDNYRLWFGENGGDGQDLECGVGRVLGVDRFLKTQAGRLSGGEKKRLSIAAALRTRGYPESR